MFLHYLFKQVARLPGRQIVPPLMKTKQKRARCRSHLQGARALWWRLKPNARAAIKYVKL